MSDRVRTSSSEISERPIRRRRGAFDIMSDILENIPEEGIRKALLANRSMLDYKVFERYYTIMLREGLITYDEKTGVIFATERGRRFYEDWNRLKTSLKQRGYGS